MASVRGMILISLLSVLAGCGGGGGSQDPALNGEEAANSLEGLSLSEAQAGDNMELCP